MKEEFLIKVKEFIEQYNAIVSKQEYLQKSKIQELINQYIPLLKKIETFQRSLPTATFQSLLAIREDSKMNWVDVYNEQILIKKLESDKTYLDTLFTKYQIPITLDSDQKRAIIADDDASLIIAGAGTGKTTTMSAKVKYLVEKNGVNPEQILVLSYTKKAVGELKRQIQQTFQIKQVDIRTFHSLGHQILESKYPKGFGMLDEAEQIPVIFKYIKDIIYKDKQAFQIIMDIYKDCFTKVFIENYSRFNNYHDYFENYKERKWNLEKRNIGTYIKNREISRLCEDKPRGLDNHTYKSKREAYIANFLYKNGISYLYEIPAPFKFEGKRTYHPDFTIENHGKKIVIEYFGLTNSYKDSIYTEEEIKKYVAQKENKEQELKKHNIDFISIHASSEKEIINQLRKKLMDYKILLKPKTDEEIFRDLMNQNPAAELQRFLAEIQKSIAKLKENGATINSFKEIIEYYRSFAPNPTEFQNYRLEILFIKEVYLYYQTALKEANKIDYADMINEAYQFLKTNPDDVHLPKYKYVLIDEYQDISSARFRFIKQLIDQNHSKVIAVGDDWQTIYTFAGSNIHLFYSFEEEFPNSKLHKIRRTYRNSQELIDTAASFILKNEEQITKKLISEKRLENPIEIVYHKKLYFIDTLCEILEKIYQETPNDSIYILSRRNVTIDNIIRDDRFKKGPTDKIIYTKYPKLDLHILTIHKAKGLTCDQAIVVDLREGVFPSTRMENNIFYSYYENTFIKREEYPFAEERRLFYVALTRTKNKVYLLSPDSIKEQSVFISELRDSNHVIENRAYLNLENIPLKAEESSVIETL